MALRRHAAHPLAHDRERHKSVIAGCEGDELLRLFRAAHLIDEPAAGHDESSG